jgi:hypothetical protein
VQIAHLSDAQTFEIGMKIGDREIDLPDMEACALDQRAESRRGDRGGHDNSGGGPEHLASFGRIIGGQAAKGKTAHQIDPNHQRRGETPQDLGCADGRMNRRGQPMGRLIRVEIAVNADGRDNPDRDQPRPDREKGVSRDAPLPVDDQAAADQEL